MFLPFLSDGIDIPALLRYLSVQVMLFPELRAQRRPSLDGQQKESMAAA